MRPDCSVPMEGIISVTHSTHRKYNSPRSTLTSSMNTALSCGKIENSRGD